MARRSPTNERYQKYTGPKGQTRKSASQAKPKRASSSPPVKSTGAKGGKLAPGTRLTIPDTPEYKAARKLWWILLGVGLTMTAVSWVIRGYIHTPWANVVSAVALGLAYAMIFYALYIDWTRLRPQRKAALSGDKPGKTADRKDA